MKSSSRLTIDGIRLEADFYGLDTRKTLALDRKRIRKEALEDIDKILDSAVKLYLDEVEEKLLAGNDNRQDKEYNQIYTYWCMVSLKRKKELLERYADVFNNVCVQVDVLTREADNQFFERKIDFKDVVKDLDRTATIKNLVDFTESKGATEIVNVQLIESLLNKESIPFFMVVVSKEFSDVLNSGLCDRVKIISENDRKLYLKSYTINQQVLPILVDAETRKYLFKYLLRKRNSLLRFRFHTSSVRRFIIGIDGYSEICTTKVPFGIEGEWHQGVGYIISPVTIKQWEDNKHLEIDNFVNIICASDEFSNLVKHVYTYQLEQGKYSESEIIDKYREFIREIYIVNIG